MDQTEIDSRLQTRARNLRKASRRFERSGLEDLAFSIQSAAQALFRGDEVSAELWLEKADAQRFALAQAKPVA